VESILADNASDNAANRDIVGVNRFHGGVRRLESNTVGLPVKTLQSGVRALIDDGDDNLTVARRFLLLDDHKIAFGDVILDHRIAFDTKTEMIIRLKQRRKVDRFRLLFGEDRATGGHQTNQWQFRFWSWRIRELDRAALSRFARDQP